ncbi:MAG TPA: PHB depolymerase family esterase [Flavitalea sp.]|nr:PHB depolymerase family esterase [Flavitalea sp.]
MSILLIGVIVTGCRKEIIWADLLPPPAPQEIIETQPAKLIPVSATINAKTKGFYLAQPVGYDQSTKRYPLIVWIHGAGQFGNGTSDLTVILREGIPKMFADKKIAPNYKVGTENLSFMLAAPQFIGYPSISEVQSFVDSIKHRYRIDTTRIYLTGMSIGGIISSDVAAANPFGYAALLPMGGVSRPGPDLTDKAKRIAIGKLPVWAFHNEDDFVYNVSEPRNFVAQINRYFPPVRAKLTTEPTGGHDAWSLHVEPTFKENNLNIYEWMLQYKR